MADVNASTSAAVRAADALLQYAGGRSVLLRLPSDATAGDPTEQLGLATPTFQDLALAPVVFRRARATVAAGGAAQDKGARWELLVSASAVASAVGSLAFQSASVLFAQAFGVLVNETLMEIESATASEVFGTPYVYRLILRAPRSLPA